MSSPLSHPSSPLSGSSSPLSQVKAAYDQTEYESVLPLDAWAESDGDALWWRFPVSEPPYVGSPLDDDFPGYVTHWTRIRVPTEPESSQPKKTAPVVEERYLDGLLHCLGCAHDHISDDPRCNDCVCGSLFDASKPALTEVEQIALEMVGDFTRWSNTGECSCDLIELAERLRTALTKRSAL